MSRATFKSGLGSIALAGTLAATLFPGATHAASSHARPAAHLTANGPVCGSDIIEDQAIMFDIFHTELGHIYLCGGFAMYSEYRYGVWDPNPQNPDGNTVTIFVSGNGGGDHTACPLYTRCRTNPVGAPAYARASDGFNSGQTNTH